MKLSICMIVKDGETVLRRCLHSMAGVFTEMVIVDTGSSDDSVQVARSFNVKVFQKPFIDFSDARNYSIEMATGEWIFVIDADETLPDGSEMFRLIEANRQCGFSVTRRNEGPDYRTCDDHPVRLFPRWARYRGRVHETVDESIVARGCGLEQAPISIRHWLPAHAERTAKTTAYIDILQQEMATDTQDLSRLAFLAADYYQIGDRESAAAAAAQIVKRRPSDTYWRRRAQQYQLACRMA